MVKFTNRYMIFEMFVDPDRGPLGKDAVILTRQNVSKTIKDSLAANFGECGLGTALFSFQVKYVNRITKLCIVRCSRDEHRKLWAAITLVRSIGKCPVIFNLLDLNGNMRACKAAALKCDEKKFEQLKLLHGSGISDADTQEMHNNLEKIKVLEL